VSTVLEKSILNVMNIGHSCRFATSIVWCVLYKPVFPKLCAAAHWCATKEAEVCRESFMF